MIMQLSGGYGHEVSERGRNLSAGQRQLIALARAQLADPAILLLDEATAALDLAAEAAVNRAISELTAARTTIVVAHRLTTASQADRIVVLDAGRHRRGGHPRRTARRDGTPTPPSGTPSPANPSSSPRDARESVAPRVRKKVLSGTPTTRGRGREGAGARGAVGGQAPRSVRDNAFDLYEVRRCTGSFTGWCYGGFRPRRRTGRGSG